MEYRKAWGGTVHGSQGGTTEATEQQHSCFTFHFFVSLIREVWLFRRQTKTTLEVSLLEKHPCSKFIIAMGNNAVGKWKCIRLYALLKEQKR